MRSRLTCVALLVLAVSATAQNFNVTRMSRVDDYAKYSDVWGYVAPDGREYALLGVYGGLSIVNATNVLAPYEVAFFNGTGCTWRDMKTWQNFVYEVNDCTGGVNVYDMTDPENPVFVNKFGDWGASKFTHAHNIQIDLGTGMCYVVGTNKGMLVFDLTINPTNPPLVTTWNGPGSAPASGGPPANDAPEHDFNASNPYIHDICVSNGMGHAANIYAGLYTVLDVTNPALGLSIMSETLSGRQFTHSTWTNADDSICIVADETGGAGNLSIYDITNPMSPVKISEHVEAGGATPHNPFVLGDVAHISWYNQGYVALDISDPANPVKIGQFDTTTGSSDFNSIMGLWGCYPFQPSGFIYCSDLHSGLYIFKLNAGCPDDPGGLPVICDVWPDAIDSLTHPQGRVVLTGSGFSDATSVTIGGVPPKSFNIKDPQTIIFYLPPMTDIGPQQVIVTNTSGVSNRVNVDIRLPAGPVLDTGFDTVDANDTVQLMTGSQPGDLHFLALSLLELPSVVPNKVAFDIGDNFSNLFLLPGIPANSAGITAIPFVAPPAAIGVTLFWQSAVVDGPLPASMTNYTSMLIE